jgi:hypothetical protein
MTSLQDASPTINLLASAHEQKGALIEIKNGRVVRYRGYGREGTHTQHNAHS